MPVVPLADTVQVDPGTAPCTWNIATPPLCCDCWDSADPAMQAAALEYASTALWAATGRQFSECTVTVRPCGSGPCSDGMQNWYGTWWSGAGWYPYIWQGTWYNCACPGACSCDPRCQIRLMGPVTSITEVTIGGVVVDPGTYRVDDGHWLVRENTDECWPSCSDMNNSTGDDVFEVTYVRGTPVPGPLLIAAGIVACEWIKACTGDSSCRLSSYVQAISRQGVDMQLTPLTQLLDENLTGIPEVDTLIRFYNPYRLKERPRLWAPELRVPRQVTST